MLPHPFACLYILLLFTTFTHTTSKPNIVYILADDASIDDFIYYGGKIIETPHVDRLAAQGLK